MKAGTFKLGLKDLQRLKALCVAFDDIFNIICMNDFSDPVKNKEDLEKIDSIYKKFGDEWGL